MVKTNKQTKKHPNNNNIYTNKHESLRIQPYFNCKKIFTCQRNTLDSNGL